MKMATDLYRAVAANDTYDEGANEGTDTVETALGFTLPTNFENLTLTGAGVVNGTGNDAHNAITGNAAANTLLGQFGNDTLTGGDGVDVLSGGAGADRLVWDPADSFNGGGGNSDELRLLGDDAGLDLTLIGQAKIKGIERINLAGASGFFKCTAQDVLDLSTTSNSVTVLGGGADTVVLLASDGWVNGGGSPYHTYTTGSGDTLATLLIDADIQVILVGAS